MRRAATMVAVVATVAAVAAPVGTANELERGKKTPVVKVKDDFFTPTKVTIKKNNKVKYKWDKANTNTHNVKLTKGPRKVKKRQFTSESGATGIKFAPKFKKKGTYKFICTFHPTIMKTTVKVK